MQLERRYNSLSRSHIMQLRFDLEKVKKGNKKMKEYLDKIKTLTDKLAAASVILTDDDILFHMQRGLPKAYNALSTTVRARPTPITPNELHDLLLTEEAHISLEEIESDLPIDVPAVFNVAHNQGQFNKLNNQGGTSNLGHFRGFSNSNNGNGRRNNHQIRGNHQRWNNQRGWNNSLNRSNNQQGWNNNMPWQNSNNTTPEVRCKICNKPRHSAFECWYRTDHNYQRPNSQAMVVSASYHPNVPWLFDSRATNHVTYKMANLNAHQPYAGSQRVSVGDGITLAIQHTGTGSTYEEGSSSRQQ